MRSFITFAFIASLPTLLSFVSGLVINPASRADNSILTKRQSPSPPPPNNSNRNVVAVPPPPAPNPRPPTPPPPAPNPRLPTPPPPAPNPRLPTPPPPRPTPFNPEIDRSPFGSGRDNGNVRDYNQLGYFDVRYNLQLVRSMNNKIGFFYNRQFFLVDLDGSYFRLWEQQLFPDLNSLGQPYYVIGNVSVYWYSYRFLYVTREGLAGWLPVDWRLSSALPAYLANSR